MFRSLSSVSHFFRRLYRDQNGQSAVETALVLPVVVLFLLVIVDFGKAFNYWNDFNQVAGEGARFAAVDRNPGGAVPLASWLQTQMVSSELKNGGTDTVPTKAQVCVEYEERDGTSGIGAGDAVKVTVSGPYNWLPFVKAQTGITNVSLRGSATMRLERAPANSAKQCSS